MQREESPEPDEQPLAGNVTAGVVRIGDTVRRPAGPWTAAVDALLLHLEAVGFTGAPRALGTDAQGRQVLEYVRGEVGDPDGSYTDPDLALIGRMIADLHAACAEFTPSPDAGWNVVIRPDREDLVCHHDLAPWNLVRAERGWVLIDWDGAGPGSRLWDLAYAAQAMTGLRPDRPLDQAVERLRVFVDGYGLDDEGRAELALMLGRRAWGMYGLLRDGADRRLQPWARIWEEDGPYWAAVAYHLSRHHDLWRRALLQA